MTKYTWRNYRRHTPRTKEAYSSADQVEKGSDRSLWRTWNCVSYVIRTTANIFLYCSEYLTTTAKKLNSRHTRALITVDYVSVVQQMEIMSPVKKLRYPEDKKVCVIWLLWGEGCFIFVNGRRKVSVKVFFQTNNSSRGVHIHVTVTIMYDFPTGPQGRVTYFSRH